MRKTVRRRRGTMVRSVFLILMLLSAIFAAGYALDRELPGVSRGEPSGRLSVVTPPAGWSVKKDQTPSGISCSLVELGEDAVYTGQLALVNNRTFYHFPEEQPLECVFDGMSKSYYVRDKSVFLAPEALDALNQMMDAFRDQGGSRTVMVVAGYRTKEFQEHLFRQSAEKNGQDHAQKFVAQPGGSEHHTGLVVDFQIAYPDGTYAEYQGEGEYAWINQNCQDFGWVVRYDASKEKLTGIGDEPWHFRYVGVPHATAMVEEDLCMEEYIEYLKQFPYDGQHLLVDCADGKYEIWYCEGSAAYLPDSGEYTVSGNNVDGLIVTCKTA